MDYEYTGRLRDAFAGSGWFGRTESFADALRGAGHDVGGLLIVGTPAYEPSHLAAHLDDQARAAGVPRLRPTLVRHRVGPGAPAHLAVDLRRLEAAGRGETVLVIAPALTPPDLLERVHDARHGGATVFAIEADDRQLQELAHESLTVTASEPAAGVTFEVAQHLVSSAAGSRAALDR